MVEYGFERPPRRAVGVGVPQELAECVERLVQCRADIAFSRLDGCAHDVHLLPLVELGCAWLLLLRRRLCLAWLQRPVSWLARAAQAPSLAFGRQADVALVAVKTRAVPLDGPVVQAHAHVAIS